ncbi:UvrD-like helicase family protein [Labedella gwakjiensis]|uniref:Helicase n=1 Tax=Labedella gwakjiensis TaxID=390269 RepID=A0A2P8GRG4_9MICO|nr:ATP-dependent RecD-like DNA helicase [Labedella gwakjiensis]PSL36560.1 UvrD-like helicase family protein [Labedella gwakjiensis]RUQ85528.1 helicase [Labedella gwakjiensis]
MSTVYEHVSSIDEAVCSNIEALGDDRGLLSQNMLLQLRNLVEGVAVLVHTNDGDTEHDYAAITAALAHIKSRGKFAFLNRFYTLLQPSTSHYTFDGDSSERLMLKYYEYLLRVRAFLSDTFGLEVLANLESFPVDLDPSLREYHEKIAARIVAVRSLPEAGDSSSRYYVLKTRPLFVNGRIYYEVTFTNPVDRNSKFDRVIAFTDQDVGDKYAAYLTLRSESIDVLGQTMPITVIRKWAVSIRPCELENFARLVGPSTNVNSGGPEYRALMDYLTSTESTLVDLMDLSDRRYERVKAKVTERSRDPRIFPALDKARAIIKEKRRGYVVLRYLLLQLKNAVVRQQYNSDGCARLSGLNLQWGCIPFDQMPFCTSPMGHNPRFRDLMEAIDSTDRTHELLARRVKNNVDRYGMLYTPIADLEGFGDVPALIEQHNDALYRSARHQARTLEVDRGHVFIRGYENEIVEIVEKVQANAATGVGGWGSAIDQWLDERPQLIDDPIKAGALRSLFEESRVALVYGAAGTGKTTMVNYIANYFNESPTLFLANTHPAVDNLRRRVQSQHAQFRTIASHNWRNQSDPEFEVVVIDECSTVSNEALLKVLQGTRFKLLVLVGDVYQIESIQFGNWFGMMRSFVPQASVFELETPYRTTNTALLGLWQKVRNVEDDITEAMTRGGYSTILNETLFEPQREDEIILCLNYDGLYGINNINRFLQSSNPNPSVEWGPATYKIGDPVVFNDSERFKPLIYNNLKGVIVGMERVPGRVRFEIDLARDVTELSVWGTELAWVRDSVVAFDVFELANSDDDDAALNTSIPFQVAYAVSIHRAQGLEYESVKVVVTDANEDDISHSIFYTALTRARQKLQVFWTPETQQSVIEKLERKSSPKDVALLSGRRGLTPVTR